jgi:hypothetical protein
MKIFLSFIAVLGFFGLITDGVFGTPSAENAAKIFQSKGKPPVLVELFTSEGCATCPPVERNLAVLEREQANPDAEIITLALHVDYWNRQGWTDKYASPLFSQRQTIYGQKFKISSIYTPQMVVDGTKQLIGNKLSEVQKAISESAKVQKANVELSRADEKLRVKVSGIPKHEDASVYLAIAENNLTTKVERGENGGRTLEHSAVVRYLKPLGRILPQDNEFEIETTLDVQPDWKRVDLKFVVFLQENQSRRILGVNSLK